MRRIIQAGIRATVSGRAPSRNRPTIPARGTMPGAMNGRRRIGILTGGGDVPGLNSVIKSVVYRATEVGDEVVGIRRGWEGLTHLRFDPAPDPSYIVRLDRTNTRTIDRTGGTMLHTSRTNPKKMKASSLPEWFDPARVAAMTDSEGIVDLTPVVLDNVERLGLDVLVTIGGDDTLSFSRVLSDEGMPLVAIPKTMDNDVFGTEYCIGFSTAITRAKELINRQRTTLGSHERIGVFRIFGRDAGFSALYTAYVTSGRSGWTSRTSTTSSASVRSMPTASVPPSSSPRRGTDGLRTRPADGVSG